MYRNNYRSNTLSLTHTHTHTYTHIPTYLERNLKSGAFKYIKEIFLNVSLYITKVEINQIWHSRHAGLGHDFQNAILSGLVLASRGGTTPEVLCSLYAKNC